VPIRVLHVLDHSWPVFDGYAQRSRAIVNAQVHLGMHVRVLTSSLHQADDPNAAEANVDGVRYSRTPITNRLSVRMIDGHWPVLREIAVVKALQRRIEALTKAEIFDVIHAHSPALCGLAALRAAQKQRIPFVYEVRSFWEDSALDGPKSTGASLKYKLSRSLENFVLRRTDAIVGIAQPMLRDLETRGIAPAKLFCVPNGVDGGRFVPRARDAALAESLGLNGSPTFGFIGTLFPWEGVSWLVKAAAELHRNGAAFKLFIVGDGVEGAEVRKVIGELGKPDYVQFLGRVPNEQIERYYSIMDVLIYPRVRARITELVTPLKPLEAMALGKAVLGSNVGGIRELIQPDQTGMLFEPGDVQDFCRQATCLLQSPLLRQKLGAQAREAICTGADWKLLAQRYRNVYDAAIRTATVRSRN
jgi:PEP-CTERM/exosortase A-associated glycosyltransferase